MYVGMSVHLVCALSTKQIKLKEIRKSLINVFYISSLGYWFTNVIYTISLAVSRFDNFGELELGFL